MLKFLGSTVGIIFLIGLVVVIVLLKAHLLMCAAGATCHVADDSPAAGRGRRAGGRASKSSSTASAKSMRDAVRATLELDDYEKRDISPAELRAAFREAEEQIKRALEPFGYYDSKSTSN